jgi:hypothetical protein
MDAMGDNGFILTILIIFVVVIVRAYYHNIKPFENRNSDKYNNIDDNGQLCFGGTLRKPKHQPTCLGI